MQELEEEQLRNIFCLYPGKQGDLVPILLEVQANFGYLPAEAIESIATLLNITTGQIYSVASFYAQFRLTPIGRNRITVCRGTACHIRGAPDILRQIEGEIGIQEGETSDDLEYTLESVACVGCCALAPVIKINEDVHGEMTMQKTTGVVSSLDGGE